MKVLLPAIFAAIACGQTAPVRSYKIVAVYPHDRKAFTEGLEFHDGYLYESTGTNGQSSIRKVDLATGAAIKHISERNRLHIRRHELAGAWRFPVFGRRMGADA